MVEKNISREFKLTNIDEARSYFVEEIKQNVFMSKKHKKVCEALNHVKHLLILASKVTLFVSISVFASLVGIHSCLAGSEVGLEICAMTAGIKKYKSMLQKKRKKQDKIILFGKK